jgi:hypothetical protein
MEHAAKLLCQGKLKIAEISEMAGYGSEAAFSRRFTRHFGLSPSAMRERAKQTSSEPKSAVPPFQTLLAGRMGKGAAALVRQRAAAPLRSAGQPGMSSAILLARKRD